MLLYTSGVDSSAGANIVQRGIYLIAEILGAYLTGVFLYFVCLVVIFVKHLFVSKSIYRINLKIFDWIIEQSAYGSWVII